MLRIFTLLILLALGLPSLALEFAALTVTPHGRQSYDVATGINTLADGGRLTDREGQVTIEGSFIRYRQDDFAEVEDARLTGSFGSLEARELYLDIEAQTLQASGPITLDSQELSFSAQALTLHLTPGIAVASGGVAGMAPSFEASALLADLHGGDVLLVGPYSYEENGLVLQSVESGDLLYLQLDFDAELTVEAFTTIPEALLEHFGPYLNALAAADASLR